MVWGGDDKSAYGMKEDKKVDLFQWGLFKEYNFGHSHIFSQLVHLKFDTDE